METDPNLIGLPQTTRGGEQPIFAAGPLAQWSIIVGVAERSLLPTPAEEPPGWAGLPDGLWCATAWIPAAAPGDAYAGRAGLDIAAGLVPLPILRGAANLRSLLVTKTPFEAMRIIADAAGTRVNLAVWG